ncbi:MAG: PAS domain S-box protein, partial [Deltaproteobacteria bacterium]
MEHKVLEEIADRIPAVIVAKSRDGKFIYANRECERLFQVKAEWLIGKTNYDFMPEDIAEKIIAHDQIVLTEGIAHQFDEEILINGERHIYSCLRFPLRDDAGNICGVGGISTDITESKRHEEALAASERRFRDFFAQVPVGMFIGDSEGNLLHVNPSFCRFTGYTEQELLSRETNALKRVTYQEDIGESLKKFNLLMSGKISELTLEKRYIRKDGRIVWGRVSATRRSEDGLYRYIAIVEDIDDRKQAEEALKASEERYRITSETAQDAIITIDEESRIVQANPATENIFGYPHGELHGKPLTMLMPEWLRQAHHDGMKRHIATGRRQLHWGAVQIPGLHRDGREIPLEISFGRFIKNGKFFFTGIARDISERKKAEEEIRESRERLRNLIETTSDLVWEVDERGVYTYASPQVSKILGYAPEEVLGKTPFDLMPPEEAERVAGIFRNIAASQQPFSFLE